MIVLHLTGIADLNGYATQIVFQSENWQARKNALANWSLFYSKTIFSTECPHIQFSGAPGPSATAPQGTTRFTAHLRRKKGGRADGNPPPERALATKIHRISTKHAFNACSGFLFASKQHKLCCDAQRDPEVNLVLRCCRASYLHPPSSIQPP